MAGGHTLNIKQGPGPRNACHPSRIRPGQRFFPVAGDRRRRFTVKRVDGEWALVDLEDGRKGRISIDRLLACDADGNGLDYRFHGWKRLPRGYRTEFQVLRISEVEGLCGIALPEWDPAAEVELSLVSLPEAFRTRGAVGSCRADLTAVSAAGLELHDFSAAKAKGVSRIADGPHPDLLAEGQEYRRRADGKKFRVLEADPGTATVRAWSGGRVVHLQAARLLAKGTDRDGLHYSYLGGGLSATRRRRAKKK
jgi:hypothetical protein